MTLPDPIRTYFDADSSNDGDALVSVFAADAVVHDEHRTYRGPEAIRAWWQAAKQSYGATAEPLEMTEENGQSTVRARVTGDFPGSPAVLRFRFALSGDRITALEIS